MPQPAAPVPEPPGTGYTTQPPGGDGRFTEYPALETPVQPNPPGYGQGGGYGQPFDPASAARPRTGTYGAAGRQPPPAPGADYRRPAPVYPDAGDTRPSTDVERRLRELEQRLRRLEGR